MRLLVGVVPVIALALALTVAQQNMCFDSVRLLERLEAADNVTLEARKLRLERVPQKRVDAMVRAYGMGIRAREIAQDCADAAVGEVE